MSEEAVEVGTHFADVMTQIVAAEVGRTGLMNFGEGQLQAALDVTNRILEISAGVTAEYRKLCKENLGVGIVPPGYVWWDGAMGEVVPDGALFWTDKIWRLSGEIGLPCRHPGRYAVPEASPERDEPA